LRASALGEVRQRYGVDPKQVPDFIALRGDSSDKLPGAAGVGPKRAAQLVRRYGSLDGVLDGGLFRTEGETLRLYRLIATMDPGAAPLKVLHKPYQELIVFLKAWNQWAEGNYLEPDRETGWAYLDAVRRVVVQGMFRPRQASHKFREKRDHCKLLMSLRKALERCN
jgi:5'-3' exonuclease, C-terminal SAM fold/Glycosyltransferase WbsX